MTAGPDVRVILLGRTGLDAALRLDPGIELVRAENPLHALGELTYAPKGVGPAAATVVIAPRVPELLDATPDDDQRLSTFINAVRIARPGVCVLGIANGRPPHHALDGHIAPETAPEALRRIVRQHAAPSGPVIPGSTATTDAFDEDTLIASMIASGTIPPTHTEPSSTPTARVPIPVPASSASPGDLALVAALLRGQDPLDLALDLLRNRLNDPAIEFRPGCDPAATGGVPVVWEGATFGWLSASRSSAEALRPHAAWLAGWLRTRDQHAQLRAAAFTDPLTGAWNRRYFDRFLATAIDKARAARRHVSVLLFDIDDFKTYNDRYGHDAGDEILRETVRLLRSVIRPTDRVCRVGGDEFAVVFDDPEGPRQEGSRQPADAFAIARRFQEQILKHRFPKLLECAPGTLTISGGLAMFPWDGGSPDELLSRADQLAMASKKQGKNAITLGPGAMGMGE
ncbi:MAG: hypothetical protein HBSAPP03_12990 [Phycisphaerae bacterium]|nr:MAG: hypothetical protein HBSAPP03_12990 [Phycisphaerae bacterium]